MGQRAHPDWSANLVAEQRGGVIVDGRACAVRARLAEGEERERLWRRMADLWPAYDSYRRWAAHRMIRVFVLAPATDAPR